MPEYHTLSCLTLIENESFFKIACKDKGEFYILAFTIPGNLEKLFSYREEEKYNEELKVFAISETVGLRKLIAQYNQKNPGIRINLEIGIPEKSERAVEDAIQTLNTEILAGEGPDILVLDGMSIDSYISRGMLEDLGPVLDPVIAEGEVLKI